VEVGPELRILLADFSELGGDSVKLCSDGYYAGDGGSEDGKHGAFRGCDG